MQLTEPERQERQERREAERAEVRSLVPCPTCSADRGRKCTGRKGQDREAVHIARVNDAWRAKRGA